ncbi:hypothetical protein ACI2WT_11895 [Lysinibacillus fusiformis]
MNKKREDKFLTNIIIIFIMFSAPIPLYFFNQVIVVAIYTIVVLFLNGIKIYFIIGNLTKDTIFHVLKSTKYNIYFFIALITLLDTVSNFKLEDKYSLITMFIIVVSILEGTTGYYDLSKEKQNA